MHGMSDSTQHASDAKIVDKSFLIFAIGAAAEAEAALTAAERHANKLRDSGKWGAKYEADLNRCLKAVETIGAAVTAK
jgi:hypothetical protein